MGELGIRSGLRRLVHTLTVLLILSLATCTVYAQQDNGTSATIRDRVGENQNFLIMAEALNNSSVNNILSGQDQSTLFLPTDEAFGNLSEGTLEALLQDSDAMESVLLNHVTNGTLRSEDLANMSNVTTLQGNNLSINNTSLGLFVGDARVLQANVTADNGIIHVINTVLIPPELLSEQEDIIDTAASEGNFTTLLLALDAANLTDTLRGEGPFTVFAPTNEAFDALPNGTVEGLLNNTTALQEILLYHVAEGRVTGPDVLNLTNITTLQGSQLPVNVTGQGVFVGNAQIIVNDINTSNGVIHSINAVLIPPAGNQTGNQTGGNQTDGNQTGGNQTDGNQTGGIPPAGNQTDGNQTGGNQTDGNQTGNVQATIIELARNQTNLTTFVAAVEAANLAEPLNETGPFTVFAPTDEAFNALPDSALETLLNNTSVLREILLYHVASENLSAQDVINVTNITTLQGSELPVSVTDQGVFVGNAQIIVQDINASNGVIHIINAVLIPPAEPEEQKDIIDTAADNGNFTTLLTALNATNLTDTLRGEGPFTVFAPTDDAFATLPNGTIESLLNNTTALRDILRYHVAGERLMGTDVVNLTNITTLQGSDLPVTVTNEGVFVGTAQIIVNDINATNGVIHSINAVLIPPAGNQTGNQTGGNQTDGNQTGGNQTDGNQTGGNQTEQNLTELYSDTVTLTEGNFTVTPENTTQTYQVSNLTDLGALNATGLRYTVSLQNMTGNMTVNMNNLPFVLQSIAGIRNDNATGQSWFTYINGTEANRDFGLNNVSNGTNLSFWYTTEQNGQAEIDNASYVANVTVNVTAPPAGNQTGNQTGGNQTGGNQTGGNQTDGNQTGAPQLTIIGAAQNETNLSTFVSAVEAANLTEALNGTGPFTVFAPNNEAFGKLSPEVLGELANNTTLLRQVLLYHVVNGNLTQQQLSGMDNVTNVLGNVLPINTSGNNITVGNATITQAIAASNGALYVIDNVLVPPGIIIGNQTGNQTDGNQTGGNQTEQNLTELYNDTVTLTQGNFTVRPENTTQTYQANNLTDIGALNATGLRYAISLQNMTGNMTANMNNLPFVLQSIEDIRNNNTTGQSWFTYINGTEANRDFGLNNVSNGTNLSFWYTTEQNGRAEIDNATYVANVTVNVTAPPAGNQTDGNQTDGNQTGGMPPGNQTGGNQTIVNQIIVNQNITQTIQSQTNLNIFVNAVQIANLNQTLSGTGPYTIFVPSNEAFNRLPAATQNELMNNTTLLRQILSYHVVSGNLTLEQLINTNNVTNVQGNVLQINTVGNNLTIQNVNITQIIIVNNGVICIIDGVLVPPGTVIGGNQTDGNQTGGIPPVVNQTTGNDTGTWYFFSIPFQANNTSVNNLLAGVNYTSLLSYNASTGRFVNATNIEPLRGYWINVPNGTQFNASQQFSSIEKRQVAVPPSLRIFPGWNALGSPVNQSVPAEAAFIAIDNWYAKVVGPWIPGNNTTGYYQNVGYNGMNGTIAPNQLGTDTFEVRPYEGYWVFIRQNNLYA